MKKRDYIVEVIGQNCQILLRIPQTYDHLVGYDNAYEISEEDMKSILSVVKNDPQRVIFNRIRFRLEELRGIVSDSLYDSLFANDLEFGSLDLDDAIIDEEDY